MHYSIYSLLFYFSFSRSFIRFSFLFLFKIRIRAITSVGAKNFLFCTSKTYFFYFTHSFLQNTHISLSILHIYTIKYSFFYNFLLFSSHPSHSLPISLSQTQQNPKSPGHHHRYLATINDQTTPTVKVISRHHQPTSHHNQATKHHYPQTNHHHQATSHHHQQTNRHHQATNLHSSTIIDPSSQTSSTRNPIQPTYPKPHSTQKKPKYPKSLQPKQKPNQPHSTRNPLIKQPEIKESNQIGGEIRDRWRDQRSVVVAISGSGGERLVAIGNRQSWKLEE